MQSDNLLVAESPLLLAGISLPVLAVILAAPSGRCAIMIIFVLVITFLLYFYRCPTRYSFSPNNVITSPSDGRIMNIDEIDINGEPYLHINTFLSPLDVHVQYSPCAAILRATYHQEGAFKLAFAEKSAENEHQVNIFRDIRDDSDVYVIQIAGFLVRRIVTSHAGSIFCRSEPFGMIKFGSRVDTLVPKSRIANVLVAVGDCVIGGQTPLVAKK